MEGAVAFVPLTRGKIAVIDAEDAPFISEMTWSAMTTGYARAAYTNSTGATESIFMHRKIIGALPHQFVDHIDGDKLNNRKSNLRLCTHAENMANRSAQKNNSAGFKGVSLCRNTGRYRAIITVNGKKHRLGRFDSAAEAAIAYDAAAIKLLGEFAFTNDASLGRRLNG
jgi:hypothetical protein